MRLINTTLDQRSSSATSSTTDDGSLVSIRRDNLKLRAKYPAGIQDASRKRDREDQDNNTSSMIFTSRPLNQNISFTPSTYFPPDKISRRSESLFTLDSSCLFTPVVTVRGFPMTYQGVFAGGALFDRQNKCWSKYHTVTLDDDAGSRKGIVQAWTDPDLQSICPPSSKWQPDGTYVINPVSHHEKRKVNPLIDFGIRSLQLTEWMEN